MNVIKNIINGNINIYYRLYAIIFLLCNLFSSCIYTIQVYEKLIPIVIILGMFLFGASIIVGMYDIKDMHTKLLMLFCFLYAVIIAWKSNSYSTDIAQLLCCVVYFFVLYIGVSGVNGTIREKIVRDYSLIIYCFNIIVSTISFFLLIFNINGFTRVAGVKYRLGLIPRSSGSQLYGIAGSPTKYCVLLALSLIAGYYLRKHVNSVSIKVILIIFDVISWICLCSTNANYFVLMYIAFCIAYIILVTLNRKSIKTIMWLFVACVLFVGGYYAYKGTQMVVPIVVDEAKKHINQERADNVFKVDNSEFDDGEVVIERGLETTRLDTRMDIWSEGLKLFKNNPLGIAKSNASVKVFYGVPNYEFKNLHNGYLTILVSSGIEGLIVIIVFGIMQLVEVFNKITFNKELIIIVSLCIAVLAGEMVNGCFVFDRGLIYAFFWPALGYIRGVINQKGESN